MSTNRSFSLVFLPAVDLRNASVIGLATGIICISECDQTGKRGKGVAIAGTIIGAIGTAFLALWIVFIGIGLASKS